LLSRSEFALPWTSPNNNSGLTGDGAAVLTDTAPDAVAAIDAGHPDTSCAAVSQGDSTLLEPDGAASDRTDFGADSAFIT